MTYAGPVARFSDFGHEDAQHLQIHSNQSNAGTSFFSCRILEVIPSLKVLLLCSNHAKYGVLLLILPYQVLRSLDSILSSFYM